MLHQHSQISYDQLLTHHRQPYPYKGILIFLLILKYIWQQYINWRQIRKHLISEIPPQLQQFKIQNKSFLFQQSYHFQKMAFQMLSLSISAALDCLMIVCNIYPFIWDNVDQILVFLDMNDEFQRATGFILIQSFLNKAFKVPLQAYSTFLIQKKYKMNNKTLQLFIYDLFVEGLLMVIIFPPILFGYLRIVQSGGQYFYFFLQFFVFAVTILLVWIHPNLIAPLFNQFKELENVPVKNQIRNLCEKIRFPLKKIFWMNGSVRSAHSNAYFYGFWKLKVIVLYDTLLSKLNPKQITSVICHQLGHWNYNHSFKMLIVYLIQVLSLFYVFSLFLKVNEVSLSFGFNKKSTFIQTALFFNLLKPLTEVFDSLRHVLTRKFQFQADQFACQQGYGPEIRNSLIKLFQQNTRDVKPDKLYAWFKHSHPTLYQRIQNIDISIEKKRKLQQDWFQKQE